MSSNNSIKKITNSETGIIKVNVESDNAVYTLQLLSSKNEIIESASSLNSSDNSYVFTNLKPGEYKLRILEDVNKNGQWDLGNFNTNTPPEPIHYFLSEEGQPNITLRANWELGPLKFAF